MSRLLTLLALLVPTIAMAQSAPQFTPPVRHTVILGGNRAGVQAMSLGPNGIREISFEFNDRGRGPKIVSRVKVDAAGLLVDVQTSGNDYMKVPVTESFTLQNGVARWKNDAESGEKKLTGPAFYIGMQSPPEQAALLAHALLKTPERKIALLPEGEASVERLGRLTLTGPHGTRLVTAFEISGLGFAPEIVWLESDGSYFASVDSWASFVREGWEDTVPKLLEYQDKRANARTLETARALTRTPAGPVAIVNANVFDTETGKSVPGTTVVFEGSRIKAVGKDGQVKIPSNAERIDARGRALLPGLADMHIHMSAGEGIQHLAAGVTSVRDLANDTDTLLATKRRIDAGEEVGPRIFMSGIIDGPGPFAGPTKVLVDTDAKARDAVDNYAKLGFQAVKIYSSVKPELVPTIIERAHEKGLRAAGHVPAFMTAREFVEAGADEIHHINFLFLNFFFDEVKDTRTPARLTALGQRAGKLELNSPEVSSLIKLLQDRHTTIDPTVTIFYSMLTHRAGTVSSAYAPIASRLPPQVRRSLLSGGLPIPDGQDEQYRASAEALLHMVKRLYDAKIMLVAGTDDMPGFTLHRELEMYVQAGIPAPDVLRIATLNAARVLNRDAESGSIAPGKLADLILIDGDPARRISDIRNTDLVIKDGKVYESAALYRSFGVQPR